MDTQCYNLIQSNLPQNNEKVINIFTCSQDIELKTPAVNKTKMGKQNLNLFQNITNSSSSTASSSENNEEFSCPERQIKFSQIVIDSNNDLESRIHEWLDKLNVVITDPYDKVADYYHQLRIQAFNRFIDCFAINENSVNDDISKVENLQINTNMTKQQSTLVMSSSPIIQRRNKIMSSDNRNDIKEFSLKKNLRNQMEDEIVISEFQHA